MEKKVLGFLEFSLNEQNKTPEQIGKELFAAGKVLKGFEKYPCVKSYTPYDLDKDGVVDTFADSLTKKQYHANGTYSFDELSPIKGQMKKHTMKYTCENGKIKEVGYKQKFKPYDPKMPWVTKGANKDMLWKGTKDPAGSTLIKDLQKKLYSMGKLKSEKFLTGNFGDYTWKAIVDVLGNYNPKTDTPGISKEDYEKIMSGKLQ